jgi:hypothetical protein
MQKDISTNNNWPNKILKNMNEIPKDIQKLIIYDHVEPNLILQELSEILNSEQSMNLVSTPLSYYLENIILKNEIVIKHLIKNDWIFNIIYEKHIIKKEKNFIVLNIIDSMALSWLIYLYH